MHKILPLKKSLPEIPLLLVVTNWVNIYLRNRMEKEIEQTLQEMRRQSELRRIQMLQEQVRESLNFN